MLEPQVVVVIPHDVEQVRSGALAHRDGHVSRRKVVAFLEQGRFIQVYFNEWNLRDFYRKRGFALDRLKTVGAECGCNEFVFTLEGDE